MQRGFFKGVWQQSRINFNKHMQIEEIKVFLSAIKRRKKTLTEYYFLINSEKINISVSKLRNIFNQLEKEKFLLTEISRDIHPKKFPTKLYFLNESN